MTTEKQIQANKLNALKGGVKTEEGKNITRFNATKHGILGKLITEYESDFYSEMLDDLVEEYQPEGALEHILMERIAIAYLQLHRLAKAESELVQLCLREKEEVPNWIDTFYVEQKPKIGVEGVSTLYTIYSRYGTSIENRLYKAMSAFMAFRNNGFVSKNKQ